MEAAISQLQEQVDAMARYAKASLEVARNHLVFAATWTIFG